MYYSHFRHIAAERALDPPTQEEVEAIERALGAQLPDSLRGFLQQCNGATVDYVIDIEFPDGSSEGLLFGSFNSTRSSPDTLGTFLGELRFQREQSSLPGLVLPLARDGSGSQVYLDMRPVGRGRILAFVHGLPPWTGLHKQDELIEVAKSFDDYLTRLYIPQEMALECLENERITQENLDAIFEFLDAGMPGWQEDPELGSALRVAQSRIRGDSST